MVCVRLLRLLLRGIGSSQESSKIMLCPVVGVNGYCSLVVREGVGLVGASRIVQTPVGLTLQVGFGSFAICLGTACLDTIVDKELPCTKVYYSAFCAHWLLWCSSFMAGPPLVP